MKSYICALEIDVDASTPEQAARAANWALIDEPSFEDRVWMVHPISDRGDRRLIRVPVDTSVRDALAAVAEVLRESDWSDVLYDDDALDAIYEIVTAVGLDCGDQEGRCIERVV